MKTATVKELFDFQKKSKIKAGEGLDEGRYPFYTSSEILRKYLDTYLYEPTCLVFGTGGKANIHLAPSRFATSTDCIIIRPKSESDIDVDYAFQFFKGNMQILEKGFKGAGLKHISKTYLSGIKIPLPPLDDQIRIAHLLGKVEDLIARRKQHLQQLDELIKSVFLEMFGDPNEMKNKKHFSLGTFIEFLTSGSRGWAKYYTDSGSIFIRINNVKNASLELDDLVYVNAPNSAEANRTRVKEGDLLLSITADLGRTAVITKDLVGSYINQHLALIRLKSDSEINPLYLAWYFTLPYGNSFVQRKNREGVKAGLNFDDIRGLQFLKPPIVLQNQFAAIVEKVEGIKNRYQQSLTELENLYGALSQKAFKGELDLSRIPLVNNEPDEQQEKENDVKAEEMTEEETRPIELPERLISAVR